MKKAIKTTAILILTLFIAYLNINSLKADNDNAHQPAAICTAGSGTVLSLNHSLKSGLIVDELTGDIKEFHYAGLEVLEINVEYIYIVQITASGKIIIRDIHRR
jgi:hypothetical protein